MRSNILSTFNVFNPLDIKVTLAAFLGFISTFIASFSQDYLGISGHFAGALAILILVDFITGLAASKKEGKKFSSSRGLRTVYKTGAYMLFLFIAFSLEKEIPEDGGFFLSVIKYFHIYLIAHIAFWELFSVDENLKRLGVDLGLTSWLKGIIEKIKGSSLQDSTDTKTDEETDNLEK